MSLYLGDHTHTRNAVVRVGSIADIIRWCGFYFIFGWVEGDKISMPLRTGKIELRPYLCCAVRRSFVDNLFVRWQLLRANSRRTLSAGGVGVVVMRTRQRLIYVLALAASNTAGAVLCVGGRTN